MQPFLFLGWQYKAAMHWACKTDGLPPFLAFFLEATVLFSPILCVNTENAWI
jgi:hypothetical protein